MRIWRYHENGSIQNLRLEEAPSPSPGPGEAVIHVTYAALNPADALVVRGLYPRSGPPPMAVGRDGSGIVGHAPPNGRFKPGDKVVVLRSEVGVTRDGTLADLVAVPERSVAPLPAGWTLQEGAAGPLTLLTAWRALFNVGGIKPGMSVLITGASGGVGTAAVMLGHASGVQVIAASRGAEKRQRLHELGADFTVDSSSPELMEREVKAALRDGRVDLVVENVAGPYLQASLNVVGACGRIAVIGLLGGARSEVSLGSLIFKRARIEGVQVGGYAPEDTQSAWDSILTTLARTGARPVVDSVFPMEQTLQAFVRMAESPFGKVLVRVAPDTEGKS